MGRLQVGRLQVAVAAPADVAPAGVRLSVFRCGSHEPIAARSLGFETASLAALGPFAAKPIHLAKRHYFARETLFLRRGCYVASARPLGLDRRQIAGCDEARTPPLPLEADTDRYLLMVSRCGRDPFGVPLVDDALDFPPVVSELGVDQAIRRVCATARDPEGEAVDIRWEAHAGDGRAVELTPSVEAQHAAEDTIPGTRRACVDVPASADPVDVTATAVDGVREDERGFISREDRRAYRFGVATPSRAHRTVRVAPSTHACADSPSGGVSGFTYWIRRNDKLLPAAGHLRDVRPGDRVEVEFRVQPGCAERRVTLAASGADGAARADAGSFGPGTHVLGVDVPEHASGVAVSVGRGGVVDVVEVVGF